MTPCEEDAAPPSVTARRAVATGPATAARSGPALGPGAGRRAAGLGTASGAVRSGAAGALVRDLRPLVAAEASAEADGAALDSGDLEQSVWVRLLERLDTEGPPPDAAGWVAGAVREEASRARHHALREGSYQDEPATGPAACPERAALVAERRRTLRAAVARAPGQCRRLLTAMLAPEDPTYREIAGELGISQGSLGPMRSRCLGCLRRMLATEVAAPELRGMER
ncbi:sigma-70 family RNA polymerase sigma factor [Streptomyces sp. NPDC058992]|uniref:sigma-70 family RNA polymerase sigma factor n=1 Tax=Streptomyces sp. NPDC058992 TaxID=3346688 RepID=UPI0036B9756F